MTPPAAAIEGVSKRLGKAVALDNVSATIMSGQVVGLIGPHGAGKTTLLRILAGLLPPDAGTATVLGRDTVADRLSVQASIGYVPQRDGLHDDLTVMENLRLHGELRGLSGDAGRARAAAMLDLSGLSTRAMERGTALGRGERRWLALACALMGGPGLLLLDDLAAGLDPRIKRALFGAVRALTGQGVATLWGTSSLGEAAQCDQVLLLSAGQVLAMAPPAELAEQLAGRTRAMEVKSEARNDLAARMWQAPGILDVRLQSGALRLVTDTPDRVLPSLPGEDAGPIRDVSPTLEDAVIVLLGARTTAATVPRRSRPQAARPRADPELRVRRLTVRRNGRLILGGIQFDLERGRVLGLIGPNGSGKSTTLRAICGLVSPIDGEVSIGAVDLRTDREERLSRLGYMGEDFSLYDELTAGQNLLFFGAAYNLPRRALSGRIDRLAADFGLPLEVYAGDLPLPVKRRLSLAAAVIHGPQFLLLDEPTLGMDALMRREFWCCLHAIAAEGVGVAVASQVMEDAEECDSLLFLSDGTPVALGSHDELRIAAAAAGSASPSLEDAFIALAGARDRGHAA